MLAEVGELGAAVKLSGGALGANESNKSINSRREYLFCHLHASRVVAETEAVATDTGP